MTSVSQRVIRKVTNSLGFIEAPVFLTDGTLLVLEVDTGWVVAIDTKLGHSERLVHLPGGPSGMAIGPDGAFYVTASAGLHVIENEAGFRVPAHGGQADNQGRAGILRIGLDGRVDQLYAEVGGRPLLAPNDLVFDSAGGFYFTDIGHPGAREADLGGLYYGLADGSAVSEVIHESIASRPLTLPNGVALSPDGSRIYVAETATARVWAWEITAPGVIGSMPDADVPSGGRMLHAESRYVLFDSMAVDSANRIVVATLRAGGLSVVDPKGGSSEFIMLPEHDPYVTNLCFGGPDGATAFVTCAGTGTVWAFEWDVPGHRLNYASSGRAVPAAWTRTAH